MPVSVGRLRRDIETIAGYTASQGNGSDRPTFSAEWAAARHYVMEESVFAGCNSETDAFGNVHVRPAALDPQQAVWLSGSHLDSVPHGGDYDGVLGCVGPLEVFRASKEDGRPAPPLELVLFAEEEGTTFGLGMLGSRTWVGTLDAARLGSIKNKHGQTCLEAGAKYGVDPQRFAAERFDPRNYLGMIELHIEQGPAMWKRDEPIALVTAIAGRRQYGVELRGTANHAGSTHMPDRRDALACAGEMITAVEKFAPLMGPQVVATVGRIDCKPNAVNVIADGVSFTIDFRAPTDTELRCGDGELRRQLTAIAERRGIEMVITQSEALPAAAMDAAVLERLRVAARKIGRASLPETVSGALHDSAILAPLLPTAMLFVASRDGISHNPAEFSRMEDCALATQVLYEALYV